MIKVENLSALEGMLEKARVKALSVNPEIHTLEFGHYRVKGSKGNFYDVHCGRTETGALFIACLCRGGLEEKPCYHAAKAFYTHTTLAKQMIKDKEIAQERLDEKNALYRSVLKEPPKTDGFRL